MLFIVVINKRVPYISHSLHLAFVYLFFIKFITYFDEYLNQYSHLVI